MDNIKNINITTEMKKSFLDYAMSVIVSRALPDVRDGLKPVHRRIIYAMNDLGIHSDKQYKKSARIVGDVMGKYHPHGDTAIYDAMVRLAQDFSTRYMLVQGHGNFGSIDGDPAAAQRYTEARMSKIAMYMVKDIKKDTIDFCDNYDGNEREPVILPARVPNLLINGGTGIAVGMATNIPPHNLGEVIDAIFAYMDDPEITVDQLMTHMQGPDFPTGGIILGRSGIKRAFETGKGTITTRSRCEIVDIRSGKKAIIVSEIPYQVQKSKLVEKIAELVKDRKIDGITDLRDESSLKGLKIVIELRKDVNANVILNNLYKQTQLQSNFSVNNLSLLNNEPKLFTLKETLHHYIDHQIDVVVRRTRFDLEKAKEREHILQGLIIALDNIDEVIKIIRASADDNIAMEALTSKFDLSEIQARAILDMRLRRLTGLERDKIISELNELLILIADLEDILNNHDRVLNIIREELTEVKRLFADERRTSIDDTAIDFIDDESLIPVENIMIMLTKQGYVKRVLSSDYRSQNRGGVGLKGMSTNEEDYVNIILSSTTHDYILFFSNKGKVYRVKGYEVPQYSRQSKGLPIVNLLPLESDELISSILSVPEFNETDYLMFATVNGLVKRTQLSEYASIRKNGKIAISLKEDDELINVQLTNGENVIVVGASNGKAITFNETDVRCSGRSASGVCGLKISKYDKVVGMAVVDEESHILVISENGYGKRTHCSNYRVQNRGGKGVKTIKESSRNGKLVALRNVTADLDLLVSSDQGMMIRLPIEQISTTGRDALGVRIINLKDGELVSNIAIVDRDDEELNVEVVE